MSLRELARRIGKRPDVVSKFARGATGGVSYELLNRICVALECDPAALLRFEHEQIQLFDENIAGIRRIPLRAHEPD